MISFYYTTSLCGRFLVIAAPYGLGPRVAAQNFLNKLGILSKEWSLSETIPSIKAETVLNFGLVCAASKFKCNRRIWIDCLMWLRSSVPIEVQEYDYILSEDFFDLSLQHTSTQLIKSIPPLLINQESLVTDHSANSPIVISFGGISTPIYSREDCCLMPQRILKALVTATKAQNDSRKIICCAPRSLISNLRSTDDISNIEYYSPSNRDLIALISTSSLYIVQPGLYGPFEGFLNKIPLTFSFPFSYTQVCQMARYHKENLLGFNLFYKELNGMVSMITGDVELEEAYYSNLLMNLIKNMKDDVIDSWAEGILSSHPCLRNETEHRFQFARQRVQPKSIARETLIL